MLSSNESLTDRQRVIIDPKCIGTMHATTTTISATFDESASADEARRPWLILAAIPHMRGGIPAAPRLLTPSDQRYRNPPAKTPAISMGLARAERLTPRGIAST